MHIKVSRIGIIIDNTVALDVYGFSKQIRIIGVCWSHYQYKTLDDPNSFMVENTIIVGDFNAKSD